MTAKYVLLLALDPEPGKYARVNPDLLPGDHVKLGFRIDPALHHGFGGEWVFVEVTAIAGVWPHASYRGELCNRPRLIDPTTLAVGQPVEFQAGHIYSVVHDSTQRPEGERESPP